MAVSVRMDAVLERQLELAAQRRRISKSQFIIEAVQTALGYKDPGKLLLEVRKEFAPLRHAEARSGGPQDGGGFHSDRLRSLLRAKHEAALAEWSPPSAPGPQPKAQRRRKPAATTAGARR